MKKLSLTVFAVTFGFFLLFQPPVKAVEKKKIVIMGTTDLHGNIFPVDYFTSKEKTTGLAKIYTLIKEIRQKNKNTLLVDSGDLIQGTPLTHYYGSVEKDKMNPMIKAMNYMGYDAFSVGNHEYDYGLDYLLRAKKEAAFAFISANTYRHNSNELPFEPYRIIEKDGIKIGIIGFTTPGTAKWTKGITGGKVSFKNIVDSGKEWLPGLRKKVDLLVAIPHSGLGPDDSLTGLDASGEPLENAGAVLAKNFPFIDVMLLGHTHTEIKEQFINGVLVAQADRHGSKLAVVEVELEKNGSNWKVSRKNSDTLDVKNVEADVSLVEHLKEENNKTVKFVNTPIGYSTAVWSAERARFEDTPIVDLINAVQSRVTGADLSSAAVFSEDSVIPKGEITIADIAGLYIYENTLTVIKISGKELKEYLEYSARFYKIDENGKISANISVPGYNYDIVSGVNYKIDVTQPEGKRITELKYKGHDVTDNMTFTLALNNYRQGGGGGYDLFKNTPVVYDNLENIRELIIEYIQKEGSISPEKVFVKNWELLPVNTGKTN